MRSLNNDEMIGHYMQVVNRAGLDLVGFETHPLKHYQSFCRSLKNYFPELITWEGFKWHQ